MKTKRTLHVQISIYVPVWFGTVQYFPATAFTRLELNKAGMHHHQEQDTDASGCLTCDTGCLTLDTEPVIILNGLDT